ncbi:tctex1 domain-containing protein 1-like isoform X2 [Fopius arisanus]|uniref:Tctex1 domain-containing protein 1-like isoform X2 n=1 Tax=Fopius arisanus TaxID=64838 RepID=A0A9R1TG12_9HYME|nr:PREDICTED: tctex1 domain-containing protein 1-like isoform X2 [Fopius arisanus]
MMMAPNIEVSARSSVDYDQTPIYQNTYQLRARNPFRADPVDEIVRNVMQMRLGEMTYDPEIAAKLCAHIAKEIRKKLMKLEFDRCKIIVLVTMIEKASQAINTKMGFVWDVERDNYSTYNFETSSFYAHCLVIGAYYE